MHIGFWDYVTFLALVILGVGFILFLVLIAGLPGRIAVARNHPDAEAVNLMGWAGAFAIVPWFQAFIWAFKPTYVVDIRRAPPEERAAILEEIARLTGRTAEGRTPEHGPAGSEKDQGAS